MASGLSKYPTKAQLQRLVQLSQNEHDNNKEDINNNGDSSVVMCNILTFQDKSEYSKYERQMSPLLQSVNAKLVWYGTIESTVIGSNDQEAFDAIGLVSYPSYKGFLTMVNSDEYQKVAVHRSRGLKGQWLFACKERPGSSLQSRL